MLDLRMPLMISGDYEPPTANLKMFEKDLSVIGADVKRVRAETPMLDVVEKLYSKALDALPNTFDTAAVYEVYKSNSK
jgi:3-hydroxyisobutyrate dehydrogenase-like beta-hydroxyacid dehydrogenase